MRITVTVTAKGGLKELPDKIRAGIFAGMYTGGTQMATVCEATANDMARFPTGELESTIKYEPWTNSGNVISGMVVAGTDHAEHFHEGAFPHFVPVAEADPRIVEGLYPHIHPVYAGEDEGRNKAPQLFYDNDEPTQINNTSNREIIGYIASSSSHPFLEEGFKATKDTVVTEIANQIAAFAGA